MTTFELNDNEFLAVKVSQPFQEFYTVKLKADYLLERSYSKAADFDGADMSGAQRKITNKRLAEIGDFIDSEEATFPNSIIIAANYDVNDVLVEEDKKWRVEEIDSTVGLYKLIVPTSERVCSVVDGQHRLFAFTKSNRKSMELNCSIYLDLIPSLQASVFATINFNQSPVDKSVAYNLFGYQLDRIESKYWSPDLLAVNMCRYFSEKEDSFFSGHINYRLATRNVPQGNWVISTASFVDGVLALISKNPKEDRYLVNKKEFLSLAGRNALEDDQDYPLRKYFIDGNDEAIKQVLESFFNAAGDAFSIGSEADGVLTKTIGIKALFLILGEILKEKKINGALLSEFPALLNKAKNIPFHNTEFFSSNTKGQGRLVDFMKNQILDVKFDEIFTNSRRGKRVPEEYLPIIENLKA